MKLPLFFVLCRCPRLCDFSAATHFPLCNLIFIFEDSFQQTFFILSSEEKEHNNENVEGGVERVNDALGMGFQ